MGSADGAAEVGPHAATGAAAQARPPAGGDAADD
jgi:hypothetical protein